MGDIAEQLIDEEMFGREEREESPYYYNPYRGRHFASRKVMKKDKSYFGVYHYVQRGRVGTNYIIRMYAMTQLQAEFEYHQIPEMSAEIQKDFTSFKKWYETIKEKTTLEIKDAHAALFEDKKP